MQKKDKQENEIKQKETEKEVEETTKPKKVKKAKNGNPKKNEPRDLFENSEKNRSKSS